jgi:hypothetical protein
MRLSNEPAFSSLMRHDPFHFRMPGERDALEWRRGVAARRRERIRELRWGLLATIDWAKAHGRSPSGYLLTDCDGLITEAHSTGACPTPTRQQAFDSMVCG